MAINTRDFGKSNLVDLVSSGVGEQIDRDRIERRLKHKWWNKIIPKIDAGQIIPNGISYKSSINGFVKRFALIMTINNFRLKIDIERYTDDTSMEFNYGKPSHYYYFTFSIQFKKLLKKEGKC